MVSILLINLDTNSIVVFDMTRTPNHPDVINSDEAKYRKFLSDLIRKVPKAASSCDKLNKHASILSTDIPHSGRGMVVVGNGRKNLHE